jgi:hypothetical protein
MKKQQKFTTNIHLRYLKNFLILFFASTTLLQGQVLNQKADSSIQAFNDAFLVINGDQTYYKRALNDNKPDGTWTLALDIFGMQHLRAQKK